MTCLVTGGTGFVGSAVVRCLIATGHDVRVLIRPNSNLRNVAGLGTQPAIGDLTDPPSLYRAMAGCDALFHVAADYRLWAPNPAEIYRVNVDGTANILRAAGDAGVRRVVYTSSVAAIGHRPDGGPADETAPASLEDTVGHYKRSKFLAEEIALRMAREQGLPVVVVNPSTPLGPRDVRPTPTGRMVLDAVRGRMPAYVDTGLNLVHVDDVATGHLLAYEKGVVGNRYILGGENMTLREILARIAGLTGKPPPRVRLPLGLLLPLGYLSEAWARFHGGPEPRVSVDALRMARRPMYFSSEKARRDLGYAPRPAAEAIVDAVAWFRYYA